MRKLLQEVLKDIKPSLQEERETKKKISRILMAIKKKLPRCTVVLGGSGQKGTWLRDSHDFDVFVEFPRSFKGKNISDLLGSKIKSVFRVQELHGSRNYFQTKQEGFTVEIIPILRISKADQAANITDISPLHAKWVNKHKKLRDDIRLTKQFFKASRVYGAESYINGFSGYV